MDDFYEELEKKEEKSPHCQCKQRSAPTESSYQIVKYEPKEKKSGVPLVWYKFRGRKYVSLAWTDHPSLISAWLKTRRVCSRITLHNASPEHLNVLYVLIVYMRREEDEFRVLASELRTISANGYETFSVEWRGSLKKLAGSAQPDSLAFLTDVSATDESPYIGNLELYHSDSPKICIE